MTKAMTARGRPFTSSITFFFLIYSIWLNIGSLCVLLYYVGTQVGEWKALSLTAHLILRAYYNEDMAREEVQNFYSLCVLLLLLISFPKHNLLVKRFH